jgi:hypothetical protein
MVFMCPGVAACLMMTRPHAPPSTLPADYVLNAVPTCLPVVGWHPVQHIAPACPSARATGGQPQLIIIT